jgi:hypothetical protein
VHAQVPKVLWEFTAQQVLTMEYAPGVKINRIAEIERMGVDRKLLAQRAVESYLQQLLTFGFFHAGVWCGVHLCLRICVRMPVCMCVPGCESLCLQSLGSPCLPAVT